MKTFTCCVDCDYSIPKIKSCDDKKVFDTFWYCQKLKMPTLLDNPYISIDSRCPLQNEETDES